MEQLVHLLALNQVREVLFIVVQQERVEKALVDPHLLSVRFLESWRCLSIDFEIVPVAISRVKEAVKVEPHLAFA